MDVNAPRGLLRAFEQLEDPRMDRTKKHLLSDMLAIAICAIICGADAWTQVAKFGRCKIEWFKTFLSLPNGIPSHDTFGRVFAVLNPDAFEQCFVTWMKTLSAASDGRLIAVDGKTIRRSLDAANDKAAIHMVSAWCETNHLVLSQVAVDDKTNEIKAIPELLRLLDLDGAVVTIDAMGCQKEIAQQIVEQDGDYLFHLKGNQGTLHNETVQLFDECLTDNCQGIAYETASTADKGHGRIEQRRLWATNEVAWFAERGKWKNLRSLIRVQCTRTVGDKTTSEYHYYISSLKVADADKTDKTAKADPTVRTAEAATFLSYVRDHWGVENGLHWCLDIAFADDHRRMRKGYAAENFARLARIALNLLKSETTNDGGLKTKRLCCGWDHDYLLKVLTQGIKEI